MRKKGTNKDTLVAIVNNQQDLNIITNQNWYRIPCKTKGIPPFVRSGEVKFIAFYLTGFFKEKGFRITHFAEIKNISIVKRKVLLTQESSHPRADEDYYKIEFNDLQKLPQTIFSLRRRRILFLSTVLTRLLQAQEINDLYIESPIEEKLWKLFKEKQIEAERQYLITSQTGNYLLDFAVFCNERNIDIECDGDKFHLGAKNVMRDKKRNNILESLGWSVLRYSGNQIYNESTNVIMQIGETINRYGGLKKADGSLHKVQTNSSDQYRLL